jgi:iduronate 2-sulfatase
MTGLRPDTLRLDFADPLFEKMPLTPNIPQWLRKFDYTAVSHGKIYHNPHLDPQSWSETIRDLPKLPNILLSGGTRQCGCRSIERNFRDFYSI